MLDTVLRFRFLRQSISQYSNPDTSKMKNDSTVCGGNYRYVFIFLGEDVQKDPNYQDFFRARF